MDLLIVTLWQSANAKMQISKLSQSDFRHLPHRLQALLKMRHQIGGHKRDAFRIAHQRLQRGPLRLELFLLRQLFAFGDFLKLRVDLRQLCGVQAEPGNPAFVIDRNRGLVGDSALDVVDGNVMVKDRSRIRASVLSMGVPVKSMNDTFGRASRRLR